MFFEDEYLKFLKLHHIEYDERFVLITFIVLTLLRSLVIFLDTIPTFRFRPYDACGASHFYRSAIKIFMNSKDKLTHD